MIDTTKQISEHFTMNEVIFSSTAARLGIDNTQISDEVMQAVYRTATNMEKIRALINGPLHVDSWFRCVELNRALGSKDTSQHIKGEAVDFIAPEYGTPLAICKLIVANKSLVRFDQLIMEHTWVHVSFCSPSVQPRGEVLSLLKGGKYAVGFTDIEGNPLS